MSNERKAFYTALESIEGTDEVKAMAKAIFEASDAEAKKYRESSDSLQGQLDTLTSDFAGVKSQLEESSTNTVPKTEMEKAMAKMQEQLDNITSERDAEKSLNEKNAAEKKQSALEKHFFDLVAEPFGAVGAGDAIAVSRGKLGYNDQGDMSYAGKTGDEAAELFRTDNARFMPNRGTSTRGGESQSNENFKPADTSFKGFQNVAQSMA